MSRCRRGRQGRDAYSAVFRPASSLPFEGSGGGL